MVRETNATPLGGCSRREGDFASRNKENNPKNNFPPFPTRPLESRSLLSINSQLAKLFSVISLKEDLQTTLQKLGYSSLNPMQEKAVKQGLLEKERIMVSAPTASGKTLLAILSILNNFQENRTKAVYVVPLRALAMEKYNEFTECFQQYGMKVAVSTGDYDSPAFELNAFDLVIVTSEKMDSLLRLNAPWFKQVGLAVIDEVHLLNDEQRGATLEVVLTKLLLMKKRLLCLSATIPNCVELAEWMEAELVQSDYRPTKLVVGLYAGGTLMLDGKKEVIDEKNAIHELVKKSLEKNGQTIVFTSSRRNAESLAAQLSSLASTFTTEEEKQANTAFSKRVLKALATPTRQCRMLAGCVENGIAFHHAGAEMKQREVIEKAFKKQRSLKVICCTTTLAMGMDYPASWVIIKDLKRFNGVFSELIPCLEVNQMCGRSGRPRFDKEGIAVLMCQRKELDEVREKYIFGKAENMYSKLSSEPSLRMHCLSLIASSYANTMSEIEEFFGKTFYSFQYGKKSELNSKISRIVEELKDFDFVREKNHSLLATPVGKRISELYLDPLTGRKFVGVIEDGMKKEGGIEPFPLLLSITEATEMMPYLPVKREEERAMWEEAYSLLDDNQIMKLESEIHSLDWYKTAKVVNAWVNEETEDNILETFDLPPGVVHGKMKIMEWLCYSLAELSFLMNASRMLKASRMMRKRLKYGIKEELFPLVRLKGVGRVKARRLYNAGVTDIEKIKTTPKQKLFQLIGEKTAEKILEAA